MNPTDEVFEELQKIPWFQDLDPGDVRKFAEISHLRHFKAGEVFFHEGDKQDYYYIVLSGRVALDIFVPHHGKVRFYTCEEVGRLRLVERDARGAHAYCRSSWRDGWHRHRHRYHQTAGTM